MPRGSGADRLCAGGARSAANLSNAPAPRRGRIAQAESKAWTRSAPVAGRRPINAARDVIVADLDERRGAALLDTAIASLPQRLR